MQIFRFMWFSCFENENAQSRFDDVEGVLSPIFHNLDLIRLIGKQANKEVKPIAK